MCENQRTVTCLDAQVKTGTGGLVCLPAQFAKDSQTVDSILIPFTYQLNGRSAAEKETHGMPITGPTVSEWNLEADEQIISRGSSESLVGILKNQCKWNSNREIRTVVKSEFIRVYDPSVAGGDYSL